MSPYVEDMECFLFAVQYAVIIMSIEFAVPINFMRTVSKLGSFSYFMHFASVIWTSCFQISSMH